MQSFSFAAEVTSAARPHTLANDATLPHNRGNALNSLAGGESNPAAASTGTEREHYSRRGRAHLLLPHLLLLVAAEDHPTGGHHSKRPAAGNRLNGRTDARRRRAIGRRSRRFEQNCGKAL